MMITRAAVIARTTKAVASLWGVAMMSLLCSSASAGPAVADEIWLLSPEEASTIDLPDEEWAQPLTTRGPSPGPVIELLEPEPEVGEDGPAIVAPSPLSLRARFTAKDRPVDMDSLEIIGRRKSFPPATVDLTDRLREYVTEDRLEARDLKIPRGRYLIEVAIADEEGFETVENLSFEGRQEIASIPSCDVRGRGRLQSAGGSPRQATPPPDRRSLRRQRALVDSLHRGCQRGVNRRA